MGIELSSKYFITRAMKKTRLEDFGGQTFEKGLSVLLNSLNKDIDLNEGTAGYFQNLILQILINRLEVTKLVKDHPDILEESVIKPIFIVGLPRSGTTILHTLMALDPTSRYLRNFESAGPICPPVRLIPESIDPRIQTYHDSMEGIFSVSPVLRGINGINFIAHGTAECQNLMSHEFVNMGWGCGSSLFTHGSWVSECNMKMAYQWHRLLLQVLQWKLPSERWVLKAPIHLFGLDQLMETYPDAKIVFAHRNPLDAIVSGVSMVYNWTQFSTGQGNIQAISDWYPNLWANGLKRALKMIKNFNSDHIVDIFHRDLSESPIKMVQKIYEKLDIKLSVSAKKRMQIWLYDNPRSKFGKHENPKSLKKQLNSVNEKELFTFYCDQYEV